jgi:hypothetical protein
VIAPDQKRAHPGPVELAQFAHEEQAGRYVAPDVVEHVARDDEEFRAARDGLLDQSFDGLAAGGGEGGRHGGVFGAQRVERAVDVEIGGVDELETHAPS